MLLAVCNLLRNSVRMGLALGTASLVMMLAPQLGHSQSPTDSEFFETRIRPVLVRQCYACHSSAIESPKGGLRLDSRAAIRRGGESGPAVVPGKPAESLLLDALRHESFEMPPGKRLPASIIADFQHWIEHGAVDPRDQPPTAEQASAASWQAEFRERSEWWSLQPRRQVHPTRAVDGFVVERLQRENLQLAPPANASVLLRRLCFVLTGLPPTEEQVAQFLEADRRDSKRAYRQLVDALLASPAFGERMARHWMDVVRYTDTYGYEWDISAKGSWEYRDYLTRAFNADVPFDQLVREQIAGDLLPQPRIDGPHKLNESLIGPMFYHFGEHRHGSSLAFNGIHQEMIHNKIDAFSKAFLGMTVACARCHDHKLDAISQADYYALAGVLMTPRWATRPIDAEDKHDAVARELRRLRGEIRRELGVVWQRQFSLADTGMASPLVSPATLRAWAERQAEQLKTSAEYSPGWLLASLAASPGKAKAAGAPEAPGDTLSDVTQAWQTLRERLAVERTSRTQANKAFQWLADFRTESFPDGWIAEGAGIRHGYCRAGDPLIALSGDLAIDRLLPRGYHSHALSSKLPAALRVPARDRFPRPWVSVQLAGGEWAGRIEVPQNAFLNEGPLFFDPAAGPAWTAFGPMPLSNGVTRVLTEISTSSLNANFPPRTGVARAGKFSLPHQDEGQNKRSWLSITGIVAHDRPGTPQDPLAWTAALPRLPEGAGEADPWSSIRDGLHDAVRRWAANECREGDAELVQWMLETQLLPNRLPRTVPADGDTNGTLPVSVAKLVEAYRQLESTVEFPRTANSMDERGVRPVDYRLNIRGDVDREGEAIPRGFLTVFGGNQFPDATGSGRLELARLIADSQHPLTPRVYVNRVWQWVFGAGIVATPNDFGHLGRAPTHPELLDWLADEFIRSGWSTKWLVRQLVLSDTFRQSGQVSDAAREADPENRWLHHYPTRRLEAEAIRDSLLLVSGRLDARLYGPPINPPRSAEDPQKRLFSGPLESGGRRSLYLEMSIMAPPTFLVTFNLPDLKLPTGRRDVTNVPAQALTMLNDPLVKSLADHWASQLVADGCETPETRVARMFVQALGRQPNAAETQRWAEAARQLSNAADIMDERAVWSELAHALFNTKEFLYYR